MGQQGIGQFEFIFVADSRTPSALLAPLKENKVPRLKLLTGPVSNGPGPLRNLGQTEATAELLLFLDEDDLVSLDATKNAVEYLKSQVNWRGNSHLFSWHKFNGVSSSIRHPRHDGVFHTHCSTIIPRQLFNLVGGYPDEDREDALFMLRLLKQPFMIHPENYHFFTWWDVASSERLSQRPMNELPLLEALRDRDLESAGKPANLNIEIEQILSLHRVLVLWGRPWLNSSRLSSLSQIIYSLPPIGISQVSKCLDLATGVMRHYKLRRFEQYRRRRLLRRILLDWSAKYSNQGDR